MVYHVSNRFLKKFQDLSQKSGYFNFSVSSSSFLAAFSVSNFVSAEASRTVLSIDRSEPRFESQTGDKIRKDFKNDGNFDVFC